MFLEDRDYKVVCNDDTLDIITQSDEQTRRDAERSAQEEVEGYLRARYDTAKAFAQTGDKRNAMLVRVTVSIALFYLGQSLPQFMGNEQRETMYNNAIAWLKDVQSGKAMPDLPLYESEDGEDPQNPVRFGSLPARKYSY